MPSSVAASSTMRSRTRSRLSRAEICEAIPAEKRREPQHAVARGTAVRGRWPVKPGCRSSAEGRRRGKRTRVAPGTPARVRRPVALRSVAAPSAREPIPAAARAPPAGSAFSPEILENDRIGRTVRPMAIVGGAPEQVTQWLLGQLDAGMPHGLPSARREQDSDGVGVEHARPRFAPPDPAPCAGPATRWPQAAPRSGPRARGCATGPLPAATGSR